MSRLGITTTCLTATLFLRLNNIRSVICQFSRRSRRLTVKGIVHLGKLLPQHCLGDLQQLLVGAGEVNRSTVHHDGSRRHLADGLFRGRNSLHGPAAAGQIHPPWSRKPADLCPPAAGGCLCARLTQSDSWQPMLSDWVGGQRSLIR